ncbi:MAG: hypothetical protein MR704_23105 [Clostridia bacterium]|nr:hypothetical protein [Clostridia bacterium]
MLKHVSAAVHGPGTAVRQVYRGVCQSMNCTWMAIAKAMGFDSPDRRFDSCLSLSDSAKRFW